MVEHPAVMALTISAAFVFGMVWTLLGSIKLALAKRFGMGETKMGGLLSALNLALIPMMLLSGFVIDKWKPQPVLLVGSLVTALALFSLTWRKTYTWALVAMLYVGLGSACLGVGSTVLMPQAFSLGSETAALNLGNVFFGLGLLITPTLADLLLRAVGFRWTLGVLALLALVPAGIALATLGVPLNTAPPGQLSAIINNPVLWLAGLVFFLYMPVEFSLGTWATTYLTEEGYSEAWSARLLSGFWLVFFGSRLLMAYLADVVFPPHSEAWVILFLALLTAVALGNVAGASNRRHAGLGLLVLGGFLGPIFPTLLGIVFHHFPGNKGMAYGTVFALGSVGPLIGAPLIGTVMRYSTMRRVFHVLMVVALLLAGSALFLGLMRPR